MSGVRAYKGAPCLDIVHGYIHKNFSEREFCQFDSSRLLTYILMSSVYSRNQDSPPGAIVEGEL